MFLRTSNNMRPVHSNLVSFADLDFGVRSTKPRQILRVDCGKNRPFALHHEL